MIICTEDKIRSRNWTRFFIQTGGVRALLDLAVGSHQDLNAAAGDTNSPSNTGSHLKRLCMTELYHIVRQFLPSDAASALSQAVAVAATGSPSGIDLALGGRGNGSDSGDSDRPVILHTLHILFTYSSHTLSILFPYNSYTVLVLSSYSSNTLIFLVPCLSLTSLIVFSYSFSYSSKCAKYTDLNPFFIYLQ